MNNQETNEEYRNNLRHSAAHLLAEAIENIYPGVKFGIGPPIANGFYYDIDFDKYDTSKIDLEKIENKIIELSRKTASYLKIKNKGLVKK